MQIGEEIVHSVEVNGKRENIRMLLTEQAIEDRIAELAAKISEDYKDKDVVAVCVLKGATPFFIDLIRKLDLPTLTCDFLGLSSYGSRTASSGVVRMTSDLTNPIAGKHLLIVEDIVDTGLTMQYLLDNLTTRRPASVKVCSLLHKPAGERVKVDIAYKGFTIENLFVVGYGLDYAERYRQLPYIGVMEFEDVE